MAKELTIADVDQAEAELREAKDKGLEARRGTKARTTYEETAGRVANLRRAYRKQEEQAGRRNPVAGPGDDAQRS